MEPGRPRHARNPVRDEVEPAAGGDPLARLRPMLLPELVGRSVVSRSRGRRDRITRRVYALADVAGLLLAIVAAAAIAGFREDIPEVTALMAVSLPVWVLLFKLYGLYDRPVKRITHSILDDLPRLFHVLLVGGLAFWGLVRAVPSVHQLLLAESVLFGILAMTLIAALRGTANILLLGRLGPERVLIVGDGPVVEPMVRNIDRHPEYGLAAVGILGDEPDLGSHAGGRLPRLGAVADLEAVAAEHSPDRVFICRAAFDADQVLELIDACRRYSLKVGILPDALEVFGPSVEIDEVQGIAILEISAPVLNRTSRLVKRGFDASLSALALVLAAPLLAVAAVAIKLSSRGPVLFRQTRVGHGGKRFRLLKLRTMVADAEERRGELMERSADPRWLKLDADPRVTRVGALLRRTSIDELPQLINVIRGEMSLVGPRPLPESEDLEIAGWGRGRLDLTPGITGLWQVLGRATIPFDEMVKLDYMYVTNWSLWLDVRLLMRTLPVVLKGRGVN